MSTRGRSTWARFTLFRSLKPQNKTWKTDRSDFVVLVPFFFLHFAGTDQVKAMTKSSPQSCICWALVWSPAAQAGLGRDPYLWDRLWEAGQLSHWGQSNGRHNKALILIVIWQLYVNSTFCIWEADLQQLKGCQHFSSAAVPTVDLIVLQLGREAWRTIVLVRHLDHRLGKCSAHEVSFALKA